MEIIVTITIKASQQPPVEIQLILVLGMSISISTTTIVIIIIIINRFSFRSARKMFEKKIVSFDNENLKAKSKEDDAYEDNNIADE